MDNKIFELEKLSERHQLCHALIQEAMDSVCNHLYALSAEGDNSKKRIYIILFEEAKRGYIYCCTCDVDDSLNDVLNDAFCDELTIMRQPFSNAELEKIFREEVYSWIKTIYPRCSFTLSKVSVSNFKDYGTALVFRYVL